MHGIVFIAIAQHLRDNKEHALLRACFPTPAGYLAISDYPDEQLHRIAVLVAGRRSTFAARPADDVLRQLGEMVPAMVQRLSAGSIPKASSFTELLTLLEEKKPLGRTLLPPLAVRREVDKLPWILHLGDPRLCRFTEGLLVGLSALFGEPAAFRHPTCMARGEAECVFVARLLRSETPSNPISSRRLR